MMLLFINPNIKQLIFTQHLLFFCIPKSIDVVCRWCRRGFIDSYAGICHQFHYLFILAIIITQYPHELLPFYYHHYVHNDKNFILNSHHSKVIKCDMSDVKCTHTYTGTQRYTQADGRKVLCDTTRDKCLLERRWRALKSYNVHCKSINMCWTGIDFN